MAMSADLLTHHALQMKNQAEDAELEKRERDSLVQELEAVTPSLHRPFPSASPLSPPFFFFCL